MSNVIEQIVDKLKAFVDGWHLEKIFKIIHDDAENLWSKINPDVQEILKNASAGVNIIQQGLNETPQFVLDKIHEVIPFFTPELLQSVLGKVSKFVNIGVSVDNTDLVTTIGNVQNIMKSMDSEDAKQYAEGLANAIAFYSTPEDTTLTIIGSLMKFVFTTFVKGKFNVFGIAV